MKALDLFCCDGGAAVGLCRAGFDDIVGIDIAPHPDYPFEFIQADLTSELPVRTDGFDFIWASPPCQKYYCEKRFKNTGSRRRGKYVDLIDSTRQLLRNSGKPYCIENIPESPVKKHLVLCGKMFGLKVYRHRHFEISGFRAEQPRHPNHIWSSLKGEIFCICGDTPLVSGHGNNKNQRRIYRERLKKNVFKGDITGKWQDAMDIHHTNNRSFIAEAVPPAYSEYIGKEFFRTREFFSQSVGIPA